MLSDMPRVPPKPAHEVLPFDVEGATWKAMEGLRFGELTKPGGGSAWAAYLAGHSGLCAISLSGLCAISLVNMR